MNKPLTWSYSVLGSFEDCPFRHYEVKVAKTSFESPSPQMTWGNEVHKALELAVKNNAPLPETMPYGHIIDKLKAAAVGGVIEAEQKMALDRNHTPVTYFAKDVWVRGITDVTIVKGNNCFIGDYKTGKPTPASAQLKLCAAMVLHHKPWIKRITTSFLWLKTGGQLSENYTRDDLPAIWQEFYPRVQRLEHALAENKWPKRPSGLCREYCPVRKCEHNGKYTGVAR